MDIEKAFTYPAPDDEKVRLYHVIMDTAKCFAYLLNSACPDSRERSLAFTKLEEVVMWANASIAHKE